MDDVRRTQYKPSNLELYIGTLPDELAKIALEVIAKEKDRWDKKELTEEEWFWLNQGKEIAKNLGETIDNEIIKIIQHVAACDG